MQHFLTGYIYP